MEARFFRYEYEYTQDGVIQSGCIWNIKSGEKTTYLYMAGEYTLIPRIRQKNEGGCSGLSEDGVLSMFILGAYTVPYIRRLVEILGERGIRTVILPYVPPATRLNMITHLVKERNCTEKLQKFLEAPYAYLKEEGVENVYLLYGNGTDLGREIGKMKEGHYFEMTDQRLQDMIRDLEGAFVPVYYAGYIIENQWLYYFGFYNVSVSWSGTRLTTDTITMFAGPVHIRSKEMNCLFTARIHTREQCCNVGEDHYENCLLKCIYCSDYDVLKGHTDKNHDILKAGVLNLGNVNLNTDLRYVAERYSSVLEQVRGISIPNCGDKRFWNKKLLSIFTGTDLKYYIYTCGKSMSNSVISDIVKSESFNRFIYVNKKSACCFFGYIAPKDEN